MLEAHAGVRTASPDFREAWEVQRSVEGMQMAHQTRQWVSL